MATQKPISTISYNSESFLREHLEDWVSQHIIQAYTYICHKGEDGDKDHIHVRIEPNKKLDPMSLTDKLKEHVANHPKPLGCRPWRPSKEEDWFLYAVHDEQYLKLKYRNEKGEKLPYTWEDIKASDGYDVEVAFIRAKASLEHSTPYMAQRIRDGEDPLSLVLQGENVFNVNAIMRTLADNDYKTALSQLRDTQNRLEALIDAVEAYGLIITSDDTGNIVLTPHIPPNNDDVVLSEHAEQYNFTEWYLDDDLPL